MDTLNAIPWCAKVGSKFRPPVRESTVNKKLISWQRPMALKLKNHARMDIESDPIRQSEESDNEDISYLPTPVSGELNSLQWRKFRHLGIYGKELNGICISQIMLISLSISILTQSIHHSLTVLLIVIICCKPMYSLLYPGSTKRRRAESGPSHGERSSRRDSSSPPISAKKAEKPFIGPPGRDGSIQVFGPGFGAWTPVWDLGLMIRLLDKKQPYIYLC